MAAKARKKAKQAKRTKPARPKAAARRPRIVKRKQPETLRLRAATPAFTVNDIHASIAWYRDVLGLAVGDQWKEGDKLIGVELKAGAISFILNQDDWAQGRDRRKGVGFRLFCTTAQNVDDLAAGIKQRGGVLLHGPQNQVWGVRDFGIMDPDGFKISVQAPIKKR